MKIGNTFKFYSRKSKIERKRYGLNIFLREKNIEILNSKTCVEKVELPSKLYYEIVYNGVRTDKFEVETTKNGNLSKSFTMYIFNTKDEIALRISFYTFEEERLLKINIYKNRSVRKILRSEIVKYHYSEEAQNRVGWEKEDL